MATCRKNLSKLYDLRLENPESVKQCVQELLNQDSFAAKRLDDACFLRYIQTQTPTNFRDKF